MEKQASQRLSTADERRAREIMEELQQLRERERQLQDELFGLTHGT